MNETLKKRIEEAADDLLLHEMPSYYEAFVKGAKYALSQQWISVDEALPQDDENVIVSMAGVPIIGKGIHVKENLKHITHWMPIPKLDAK